MSYYDFAVKFWEVFKELAQERFPSCLDEFGDNRTWTLYMVEGENRAFMGDVVRKLGDKLDLHFVHTKSPYFGNDQTWFIDPNLKADHWTEEIGYVEIAIEHENSYSSFMTEIYRLSQVVVGLKVGITYANDRERRKTLPKISAYIRYRPIKPESDDYLIIFGPHYDEFYTLEWTAYHFDKYGNYSMIDKFKLEETRES